MKTKPDCAMVLLSTRPRVISAEHDPASDTPSRALDPVTAAQLAVKEVQWPAFELKANTDAWPLIDQWLEQRAAPGNDCVVFVSPGALTLARPAFPATWPAHLRCAVMGDGSAAKAVALGIPESVLLHPRQTLGESQDAAGLLTRLRATAPPGGFGRMLLVKGPAGNPDLPAGLQTVATAGLTVCEAYHRHNLTDHAQTLETLRAVHTGARPALCLYLTSSEAARTLIPIWLSETSVWPQADTHVLVTHPKIAKAVLDFEPGNDDQEAQRLAPVVVSPGPAALAAWLLQHFSGLGD